MEISWLWVPTFWESCSEIGVDEFFCMQKREHLMSRVHLHDQFPDEQAELFSLLERLLVGVVGGGDKQVVDLIFAISQTDLGLVLDDVVDLVELSHPVQDVVGACQLLALANRVFLVGVLASSVVEPFQKRKNNVFYLFYI